MQLLPLTCGRGDDRFEPVLLKMVEAVVGAIEPLHERPLDRGDGRLGDRPLLAQVLPVVGQRMPRIDDIDLLDAERVHVADHRSDVLHVGRVLEHGDEILAAERLDLLGAPADGFLRCGLCFFHVRLGCSPGAECLSFLSGRAWPIQTVFTYGCSAGSRPATGRHPMRGVRMPPELEAKLDAWIDRQPEPKHVRRLRRSHPAPIFLLARKGSAIARIQMFGGLPCAAGFLIEYAEAIPSRTSSFKSHKILEAPRPTCVKPLQKFFDRRTLKISSIFKIRLDKLENAGMGAAPKPI